MYRWRQDKPTTKHYLEATHCPEPPKSLRSQRQSMPVLWIMDDCQHR